MMHMFLDFTRDVQFVFKSWYAKQDDDAGYFYLGLVLTLIYSFLHMFLPTLEGMLKRNLMKQKVSEPIIKIILAGYQFIFQMSNVVVMMLMMTMNFWTGLAIALGCGIGYFFTGCNAEWQTAIANHENCEKSNTSSALYKPF